MTKLNKIFEIEYWGDEGAGALIIAKNTGRILLFRRTEDVNEPGTWNLIGGKIDAGESSIDAAMREIEEESGLNVKCKLTPIYTFRHNNFRYDNFLAIIPDEFTPKLNWEHDTSMWVEWGEWPHPMHFGLEALLKHAGEKIHRVVTLIKRKKASIIPEIDAPPAIVQPASINSGVNYNMTNFLILAITLYGEAAQDGTQGLQAVMNVIMNRAKGDFNKAKDIALSPKQFSMWNNITNIPDYAMEFARVYAKENTFREAIKIVELAKNNKLPDITGGATFYFNPKKVSPSWAKQMVKTKTIGNHDFYKLSPHRKTKRGRVPTTIREMIESQDPHKSILFKKGLAGDGIWEYELKSPKSYLRYRYEPDTNVFYLDNIGTPNLEDKNKGYAKAILETFFQLIKRQNGVLDSGPYTVSGTAYIKHVVERFAQQYGVRLVKGHASDLCETTSPELKHWFGNSKVVDKHGDPLVVWKGMRWEDDKGFPITHIQRQEDFPAFYKSEPGIKGIAGFFTSDQTVARKFCFGSNTSTKPFYLKIENPFIIDMKGGKSGDAQFDKQGQPFRDAMRSGKYDGAFILNTADEGNVFIITNPSQAKLATNKTFGPDKDFTKESAVDNSYKNGRIKGSLKENTEADRIPKNVPVVLGTVFPNGDLRAKAGWSDDERHPKNWSGNRWRYVPDIKMLNWWENPTEVEDFTVKEFLRHNGFAIAHANVFTARAYDLKYDLKPKPGEIVAENKLLMEAITDEQAKAAVEFLKKMVAEGPFKGQVYLAGGPVRDMIMGKTPKDLDLSIVSDTIWGALRFTSWLAKQMGNYKGPSSPPPTFDKHIETDDYGAPKFSPIDNDPVIISATQRYNDYYAQYSNPVIFPKFGTAKLNLTGVFNGVDLTGVEVEAVSARKEIYEPGNRKPIQVLPGTLQDDVFRRDFRCNSLMYDLTTGQTHDLSGHGVEDIKNRVLVTTSNPEMIFKEDPLRMMRAVRFMVQKGFKISSETEANIKKNASWLKHISRERIRDEIDKILVTKDPGAAFRKMNELGLLQYVAPEFQQMIGMTQNIHHEHDVFDHTMAVLSKTQPELVRRRIALFHDIGKLVTHEVTPSGVHFYGHEDAGAEVAEKIMTNLKYPKLDIDAVKLGIRHHMKLKHGGDDAVKLSDKSLRKFKISVGQYLEHILDVIHADNTAHASASAMPNQIAAVRKRLDTLDIKEVDKPILPITGNDLIAIGIKPGPMIGKILSAVTDAWYENPSITKDQAMKIAQQAYGKS